MWQKARVVNTTIPHLRGREFWTKGKPLTEDRRLIDPSNGFTTNTHQALPCLETNIISRNNRLVWVSLNEIELLPIFAEEVETIPVDDFLAAKLPLGNN